MIATPFETTNQAIVAAVSLPVHRLCDLPFGVDYFAQLSVTPRDYTYILLFTDRFSRCADMFAVTAAIFMAEGMASIPQDSDDMPEYLLAGLTHCVLNNSIKKSPPSYVTRDDVATLLHRLEVENNNGHNMIRGRGGVIAVLCKTHWTWLSHSSSEGEINHQLSRQQGYN